MPRWDKSDVWKQYKRYYAKIGETKTVPALDALSDELSRWDAGLARLFPENKGLVEDLRGVLHERVRKRLRILQVPRGRLPRPDHPKELTLSLKRLRREYGALKGLQALEGSDPWVEKTLLPEVQHTRAVVATLVKDLEKDGTGEPGTTSLMKEAQELLKQMDETLGEIPQELLAPSP